ncbi:MAG: hypothetical protein Q8J88_02625 [Bacteroidales bacterium]|nr:hypothetical protein [Bacteroidales bacterium]
MKIKYATVTISVMLMINILVFLNTLIYSAPSSNLVTCYSTFEIGIVEENKWEVYDCGACTKKLCKSYSNQSNCRHFPSGNVNLN